MKAGASFNLLCCFLVAAGAAARDEEAGRWVTFKVGRNSQGRIEHQIDHNFIRQEGPYRTFWTRLLVSKTGRPLVFSSDEKLFFWSQKFAVDCGKRQFGTRFIDSTNFQEAKAKATLQNAGWESLDKYPIVRSAICENKTPGGR
jgi:hypothetical protein